MGYPKIQVPKANSKGSQTLNDPKNPKKTAFLASQGVKLGKKPGGGSYRVLGEELTHQAYIIMVPCILPNNIVKGGNPQLGPQEKLWATQSGQKLKGVRRTLCRSAA